VIKKILPILDWLPSYSKSDFFKDLPAGITVGIMLIPQGMAYALIAGLPMVYGLYASLVPQVIYALTGTSRQLAVGPVAMDSLLVAAGLTSIAVVGSDRYIELAIVLALMMGSIQLLLGIMRAGFLVNFLSKPIISGFTSAAALIIGANQITNLLGIEITQNNQLHKLIYSLSDAFGAIHMPTLLIGIGSMALLVVLSKYKGKIQLPATLVVVVVGIVVVKLLELNEGGVAIVGVIPEGLPSFLSPSINSSDFTQLLPIAVTLALIAFMEAYSIAKTIEERHDYKIDANQELRALGLANIFGALFKSYPTTGGFSRTAVNEKAGAVTPMASLISAALIAMTLLFLTPLFYHLPKAVLASIVIVAVSGLVDIKLPILLWKKHKVEAGLLFVTFIVTATVGMTQGIGVGVGLSIVVLVFKQMRPHFAELGEIEGVFRNVKRFENAIVREDLLIVRFDASVNFANHRFLNSSIKNLIDSRNGKVETIILCAESIGYIDASGLAGLENLIDDLEKRGIDFRLSAAIGPVRDVIGTSELMNKIGKTRCFTSITTAIEDIDNPGSLGEGLRNIATQESNNA
jgi:sulfate permease, SulP family